MASPGPRLTGGTDRSEGRSQFHGCCVSVVLSLPTEPRPHLCVLSPLEGLWGPGAPLVYMGSGPEPLRQRPSPGCGVVTAAPGAPRAPSGGGRPGWPAAGPASAPRNAAAPSCLADQLHLLGQEHPEDAAGAGDRVRRHAAPGLQRRLLPLQLAARQPQAEAGVSSGKKRGFARGCAGGRPRGRRARLRGIGPACACSRPPSARRGGADPRPAAPRHSRPRGPDLDTSACFVLVHGTETPALEKAEQVCRGVMSSGRTSAG